MESVVETVRRPGMHVEAVGISLSHDGRKIIVANCPIGSGPTEEAEGAFRVIANREIVRRIRAVFPPAIASTPIIFDASTFERVVRISFTAALEVATSCVTGQ